MERTALAMSVGTRPIERAMAAHREGRHKEAEVAYRRILRQTPRDPDALHYLGVLHLQRGDPATAYQLMRQSLEVAPDNHHAWINLGNVLMRQASHADAQRAYERALELAPESIEAWFDLGVCHRRQKAGAKAAACLIEALKLQPAMVEALEALARIYYQVGQRDKATEVYRQWVAVEPDNPIPRHMLAANSSRDVPQRAEDSYVKRVFDEFADHFDENLAELDYQAPQLIAEAIGRHVAAGPADLDLLDAGCGTGLCGALLRPVAGHLCGVDLSPGMLAHAEERGVYDELVESELCAFMRSRPAAFDVIVIADTLVYFGALEEALQAASLALRAGATLAFTVERLDESAVDAPYRIEPHGRYSHAPTYVDVTLAGAGLELVERSNVVLRRERGADVAGLLVVGRRRVD